jgi:lipopolysaccharide/colanic/teichoic acid biosynthesis glycosyltransferase
MNTLTITDEAAFKRMLSLERMRSERTGAPLLLVLLDGENAALQDVGPPLSVAFRDTDVTGWYRSNFTLGTILTTLNGCPRETITSAISTRVAEVLARHLRPQQIQRVELSFHFFPEEGDSGVTYTGSEKVFYPDFQTKQMSNKLFAAVKRTIDVIGSLAALILLSPVLLAIASGIKATSAGPVLFRQKRLGKDGVPFTFLKFRSMYVANDPNIHQKYIQNLINGNNGNGEKVFKIKNDPRVTRLGHFLRVSSLDELPQFINVLTGTMSLVGPRPPIPYEVDCYKLWHRRRVLDVKPGITGVWQVQGRSRTTFDEMVRMDLQYIRNQSLGYDLRILLKTPLAVISREGAY